LPSGELVYSNQPGRATSARTKLLGSPSDSLIHHGSQSCFRISQVLREKRRALFRLSAGQQLIDSTVNWNEATWIIMPEIHEDHPHPQFT